MLTPLSGALLRLLAGERCAGCRLAGRSVACAGCLALVRSTPAAPSAAFVDAPPLSRMVRAAKEGHWHGAAPALAALVLERWPPGGRSLALDGVTWVPADRRRQARRGGHLPEGIARELARHLGLPVLPLLERRTRRPQRGLDRPSRADNARGAYLLRRLPCPSLPAAPRLLLVDDVRTTGATLAAAADALAPWASSVEPLAVVGVPLRGGSARRSAASMPHEIGRVCR